MFKPIFELLTEPLGLPIEWYYEYIILAMIGIIAFRISYKAVGDMYESNCISGSFVGSILHWLFRFVIFVVLWAVIYGIIWFGKLVLNNWKTSLMITGSVVGLIILIILLTIMVKRIRKRNVESK